jgi:hypothetical protein
MVQVVHVSGPPEPLSRVVQMVQSPGPSDHFEPTLNTRCANQWLHSRCSRAVLALGAKIIRNIGVRRYNSAFEIKDRWIIESRKYINTALSWKIKKINTSSINVITRKTIIRVSYLLAI